MQDRIAALGADAYPEAIGASGVDPKCHIAPAVGEDFQDAPVDEYPQLVSEAVLNPRAVLSWPAVAAKDATARNVSGMMISTIKHEEIPASRTGERHNACVREP